jgi:DNA mismatch endonuclease, patch repair protein
MRGNRRKGTRPERLVASALHRAGYRFRRDLPISAGETTVRPDLVFTRRRVAVFIDGCFWHCCPEHSRIPRSNVGYWKPKLQSNVARDERANRALRAAGWAVVRVWEHEEPAVAVARVVDALRARSQRIDADVEPDRARATRSVRAVC